MNERGNIYDFPSGNAAPNLDDEPNPVYKKDPAKKYHEITNFMIKLDPDERNPKNAISPSAEDLKGMDDQDLINYVDNSSEADWLANPRFYSRLAHEIKIRRIFSKEK